MCIELGSELTADSVSGAWRTFFSHGTAGLSAISVFCVDVMCSVLRAVLLRQAGERAMSSVHFVNMQDCPPKVSNQTPWI